MENSNGESNQNKIHLSYLEPVDSEYLKNHYKTKEDLIKSEAELHYRFLDDSMGYTIINKDMVDKYLSELSNCDNWEEIKNVYNRRPYNRELR